MGGPRGSSAGRPARDAHRLLLEARDVSRTVGGLRILAPVSVEVEAGRCLVLRGRNGSGKTTLLRLLLGLDRPSSGRVRLVDKTLSARDIAGALGAPPFFENLTVLEHLLFVRASWGLASGSERPLALLRAFDAERLSRHFPDELSSGERQIVTLCLALARPARVLVLDEPEQRLDEQRRAALAGLLRTRLDEGAAVVLATHAADLSDAVADRVLTLEAV